ncbi:terminase family protein [Streptomyces sp. NBC_00012]|uniref:terminase large subunit domain-containing protein n=1 Tax=Streptomyces sp. NBC_00012 TaxID=2975621 RepID=UPI003250257E
MNILKGLEAAPEDLAALAVRASPVGLLTVALQAVGAQPDPWQRRVLASRSRRLIVIAARQSGKGSVSAARALHLAVTRPGSLTLIVSASERQARIVLDRMREMLPFLGEDAAGAGDTQRDIRLANGSQIVVLPESSSSLRGWTCDALLVDEAAYVSEASWHAIVPTTVARGASILVCTSAGTVDTWCHQIYSRPDLFPEWERHTVRAADISRYDKEFLEQEQRRLPPAVFASEYESVFAAGGDAAAFEPLLIERAFEAGRETTANPWDMTDLFSSSQE